MIIYHTVPESGDPSDRTQYFKSLHISILCCRYWWLEKWKSNKMSFPYWRIYWNKTPGAYVKSDRKVELNPDRLIVIPPYTTFSTDIESYYSKDYESYDLVGNRIECIEDERYYEEQNKILHLFIHFNLNGIFYSAIKGIYSFELSKEQELIINKVIEKLLTKGSDFDMQSSLEIYQLIISALKHLPQNNDYHNHMDFRIYKVLDYIHHNMTENLLNKDLAEEVNMSTNAFCRLFKKNMNTSPQDFIRKTRIAKASELLDHSSNTIDEISDICGFSDRFHFSKSFKNEKGLPPAEYRNKYNLIRKL